MDQKQKEGIQYIGTQIRDALINSGELDLSELLKNTNNILFRKEIDQIVKDTATAKALLAQKAILAENPNMDLKFKATMNKIFDDQLKELDKTKEQLSQHAKRVLIDKLDTMYMYFLGKNEGFNIDLEHFPTVKNFYENLRKIGPSYKDRNREVTNDMVRAQIKKEVLALLQKNLNKSYVLDFSLEKDAPGLHNVLSKTEVAQQQAAQQQPVAQVQPRMAQAAAAAVPTNLQHQGAINVNSPIKEAICKYLHGMKKIEDGKFSVFQIYVSTDNDDILRLLYAHYPSSTYTPAPRVFIICENPESYCPGQTLEMTNEMIEKLDHQRKVSGNKDATIDVTKFMNDIYKAIQDKSQNLETVAR